MKPRSTFLDRLSQLQVNSSGDLTTGPKADRAAVFDKDDDFSLADVLVDASDEEIEQMPEQDADADP